MKKITLTLLGLVAFSTSALAQQEVKFGPKAGVNFASINGKVTEEGEKFEFNKGQTGFHVGAFAEIKFNDKFAIQPELLYSVQGAKIEESASLPGMSYDLETKWNLHYINVPIMAKYYVIPSVAIEVGPYVGFNIKSEMKSEGTYTIAGVTESENETQDFKKGTNSVDFGLGAGASFNMDNGFFVGARYNLGLAKISKDAKWTEGEVEFESTKEDFKNGVIQISVGYKF